MYVQCTCFVQNSGVQIMQMVFQVRKTSNEADPSFVHGVANCLQDIAGPEEKGVPRGN